MARTMKSTRRNLGPRTQKTQKVKITKTVKVKPMKEQTKAGVLAVVRRMLARNMENKVIGYNPELGVSHNSAISGSDCRPLIPQILPIDSAAGSTSTQRMGDRISPKSLTVKGFVSFKPDTLTNTSPVYVRVLILAQKSIKVGSQVLANAVDTSRLLRPAIGPGNQEVQFTGQPTNLLSPINRDLFHVYFDRLIKLAPQASTGVEQQPMYNARYSYKFKKLPAALTFDEGNGNWANNFAPFVAVGYGYVDGNVPDVINVRLIHTCFSQLQFEDA